MNAERAATAAQGRGHDDALAPTDALEADEQPDGDQVGGAWEATAAHVRSRDGALPPALRRRFEQSVGEDLGGVAIHADGDAADGAAALGAQAFTVGQDIYFGDGQYQPDSAQGQELIAHEVAHTVQQAGGAAHVQPRLAVSRASDPLEREADVAAAAMVRGEPVSGMSAASAQISRRELNAVSYQVDFREQIERETTAFLRRQSFATHSPFASWLGDSTEFVAALLFNLQQGTFSGALDVYLPPENTSSLIDRARKRNVQVIKGSAGDFAALDDEGPPVWFPDVAVELGNAMVRRITESLRRLVPRYVAAAERLTRVAEDQLAENDGACAPADADAIACEVVYPVAADLLLSAPIDLPVATVLCDRPWLFVDVSGYRARGGDGRLDTRAPGELRAVELEAAESPGSTGWWVRATPPDASVEEVSLALWGVTTRATELTKVGHLFVFADARDISPTLRNDFALQGRTPDVSASVEAPAGALLHVGADVNTSGQCAPGDPATIPADLVGGLTDEAALADAPPAANVRAAAEVRENLALNRQLLLSIRGKAAQFGFASRFEVPIARVEERLAHVGDRHGDPEAARWDAHTAAQGHVLESVDVEMDTVLIALQERVDTVTDRFAFGLDERTRLAMRGAAEHFVAAAELSHLPGVGRQTYEEARARAALLPIEIAEIMIGNVMEIVHDATKNKVGDYWKPQHDAYEVPRMSADEIELRTQLGALRTKILNEPAAAAEVIAEVLERVSKLHTEAFLVANMDHLDAAWAALSDADGIWAWVVNDDEELAALRKEGEGYWAEWKTIHHAFQGGDMAAVEGGIKTMADNVGFQLYLKRAYDQVEDTQKKAMFAKIAALFVITVVSMGAGSLAGGAAMGAGLGATGTFIAATAAEAAVFTIGNAVIAEDPNVLHALGDFAFNFAMIGTMRKAGKLIELAELGKIGRFATEFTVQTAIGTGFGLMREEIIKLATNDGHVSAEDFKRLLKEGMVMGLAQAAVGLLARPMLAKLHKVGRGIGARFQRATEARAAGLPLAQQAEQQRSAELLREASDHARVATEETTEGFKAIEEAEASEPDFLTREENGAFTPEELGRVQAEREMNADFVAEQQGIARVEVLSRLEPHGSDQYLCNSEDVPRVLEELQRAEAQEIGREVDPYTRGRRIQLQFASGKVVTIVERFPVLTEGQQAVERWVTHSLESDPAGDSLLHEPGVREWYDRWMRQPERVTPREDGSYEVKYPEGTPEDVRPALDRIARESDLGLLTDAVKISEQIQADFPDVATMDPLSPEWQQRRPELVRRFGEAGVAKYEQHLNTRLGDPDARVKAASEALQQQIDYHSLHELRRAFPDCEIYVSGSVVTPGKQGHADADVVIVAPEGTTAEQRAAMEARANGMTLSYRPGSTPGGTPLPPPIQVHARVMSPSEHLGWSAATADGPAGRTPITEVRIDFHQSEAQTKRISNDLEDLNPQRQHSLGRHGPEIPYDPNGPTPDPLKQRLLTGIAPDGKAASAGAQVGGASTKFKDYGTYLATREIATHVILQRAGLDPVRGIPAGAQQPPDIVIDWGIAVDEGYRSVGTGTQQHVAGKNVWTYPGAAPIADGTVTRTKTRIFWDGGQWVVTQHFPTEQPSTMSFDLAMGQP